MNGARDGLLERLLVAVGLLPELLREVHAPVPALLEGREGLAVRLVEHAAPLAVYLRPVGPQHVVAQQVLHLIALLPLLRRAPADDGPDVLHEAALQLLQPTPRLRVVRPAEGALLLPAAVSRLYGGQPGGLEVKLVVYLLDERHVAGEPLAQRGVLAFLVRCAGHFF